MTPKAHVARFLTARDPALGDPHGLADDRLRVLWVLAAVREDPELAYMTPSQVADVLCDGEAIHVPRQRAAGILQKERGTVAKKRYQGRIHYRIMKQGLEEVAPASLSSVYVDPEQALSQIRRMEEVLASLKGDLKICDPYIENKTLDFIAECTASSSIKLLTVNVLKETKFRRDLAAYQKEHTKPLEVRVAPNGGLHDRYILHEDGMLLMGTSLNGFAKKQSFLVTLGPDIKAATETAFNKTWASATKF
ncbi:hypothetical protein [Chelativorans intermedius]|uniref:Phospholipase D-like domain-containing protein n=1 Tax=Chelativorans intermedius TaxID=515947 RepID=A0ABV6D4U9_9HYPH|nr:hypothetical protein [Chelativorans intermedius]MCT8999009.1 hypothetical protein [Chelativorans intermedius]